jgi:hypothetical protein
LRKRAAAAERALLGSLAEHGQQLPIVVIGEQARFVVIDGYKRAELKGPGSHSFPKEKYIDPGPLIPPAKRTLPPRSRTRT